ncbi:hypothetical protein [Kordiimonas aestuarii]|uniref:hypothetical protein n=1 Tax=Kordiimonas aestuarii TaxID=1005925 RepID=UPI0021CEAB2A|nr:hypothetical protein [Kordiimonas aestuarii]
MSEAIKFQREIELLANSTGKNDPSPIWLISSFADNDWTIDLGQQGVMSINFGKRLEDGSSLLEPQNSDLLNVFKHWIVGAVERSETNFGVLRGPSRYRKISATLALMDYFLLRAEQFQLSEFGLSLVSINDIRNLLEDLVRSSCSSLSVYRWPIELKSYLDRCIVGFDADRILNEYPILLSGLVPKEDRWWASSEDEIFAYRAYLWSIGLYYQRGDPKRLFSVKRRCLGDRVFSEIFKGGFNHPAPPELEIWRAMPKVERFDAVSVKAQGARPLPKQELGRYAASLRALVRLNVSLEGITEQDIDEATKVASNKAVETGRFKTVPHRVVTYALRSGMEFYLRYGSDLLNAYVLCCEIRKKQPNLSYDDAVAIALQDGAFDSLSDFAIAGWFLDNRTSPTAHHTTAEPKQVTGLINLIQVLFGAIHITVAALSARRISEFLSVPVDRCLDATESFLVFYNRKSGAGPYRAKKIRPVPTIVSRMIGQIKQFQTELIEIECLPAYVPFLCVPKVLGVGLVSVATVKSQVHINRFCDFFDMPGDGTGTRYYIRTHQLRRFFAMAFFWSGTPSGEDTLSWFLAHTDPEHLYRYITEETTGEVLRTIKAGTISAMVGHDAPWKEDLETLMFQRFGVKKFTLLTENELNDYLEALLEEGTVDLEPVFYESEGGKRYRMCVKISPLDAGI